jgi:signal transduction histidine kinase
MHFLCRPAFSYLGAILGITLLLLPNTGTCQLSKIDSLKIIIQKTSVKANKMEAIFALCQQQESLHADTLYVYALQAKQLASALNSSTKTMEAEYYEAICLFKKNKLDSALEETNRLISKYTKTVPYNDMHVNLYVLKFNAYWRKNNFNEAIATSQVLLALAEEQHDITGLIKGRMDMGAAHHIVSNQPKEGLKWYYKALDLLSTAELKAKFSSVYQNIAIAYDDLELKDSIFKYLELGLRFARQGDNKANLARALRLYGSIMADYNRIKDAEPAFREAIEVQKGIGDIFGTVRAMQGEADFYASTGRNEEAIKIYIEALVMAEKNGLSVMMLNDLNKNLSLSYNAAGNYKKSNEVLQKMLAIKDSNYKLNSAQSLAEMQTKFDVQQKEILIAKQKLDLLKQNLILYGSAMATVILLFFLAYRFKKYKQQQKTHMAAMMEEEKRQSELAMKAAEEKERKRIAAELHDNLGVQANAILHNSTLLMQGNSDNKNVVADLQETAKEMLLNLRETLWAMKATDVAASDLWLRIISFMKQMSRHYTSLKFVLEGEAPKEVLLPSNRALNIVLVLQETVNNAVKHAGGTTIIARSSFENDQWLIVVQDDGKGFNINASKEKNDTYGLSNMQERALAGNFNYSIETGEGSGVKATISVSI